MKDQIKELRLKIDGLAQLVIGLKPIEIMYAHKEGYPVANINSDEIKKSRDSLLLAKCWLGKILQELGEGTPYKNDGKRKTVEDIEPAADKVNIESNYNSGFIKQQWNGKNHIEKVDYIREQIKECVNEVSALSMTGTRELVIARTNSYTHLSEARFWLGFELERLRKESK